MRSTEAGFTIIELMIATAVFTVILLITTTAIIGISKTYISGSVQNQTQQTSRAILTDISQDIQFNDPHEVYLSGLTSKNNIDYFNFCIGNDVYVFTVDKYLSSSVSSDSNNWVLVRYQSTTCPGEYTSAPSDPLDNAGAEELLVPNERLGQLNIVESTVNGQAAFTIEIEIGYSNDNSLIGDTVANDSEVINDATISAGPNWDPGPSAGTDFYYPYACQPGSDNSFCAVSVLTTTITSRINDEQ